MWIKIREGWPLRAYTLQTRLYLAVWPTQSISNQEKSGGIRRSKWAYIFIKFLGPPDHLNPLFVAHRFNNFTWKSNCQSQQIDAKSIGSIMIKVAVCGPTGLVIRWAPPGSVHHKIHVLSCALSHPLKNHVRTRTALCPCFYVYGVVQCFKANTITISPLSGFAFCTHSYLRYQKWSIYY